MDIRRRAQMGGIKKATSGGFNTDGSYTVNLNGQWEETTAVPNPDSTLYDGVYRSSSNYHVGNGVAIMYITIKDCSSFTLYIRSYAESNYDYMMVSQLDKTITGSTSYSNTTLVKAHTRGNQQSGTALSSYTLVEFTGITPGEHTITVVYRKDSSFNNGDDRGYVLIPKIKEEGDIEIDTTYSIQYTSSDGNIVTPYSTNTFGANIISNNYINGQGIISFDSPIMTIGSWAFGRCTSLTSVTIPDSVTMIGSHAFYSCYSLTSVTIPDSVTTIEGFVFWNCTSLTSVTIPDSVTSIGDYAFYSCYSLTSVYCKATTPPALGGTSVFDYNGSGRKIYVPTESVDAYKSATNWSEYADAIVGYDFEDDGEESVNLITFTVDGVEYQAEEGMTWEEWCDSEYNVSNFIYDIGEGGYAIFTSDRTKYFIHPISTGDLVTTGTYSTRNVNWPTSLS